MNRSGPVVMQVVGLKNAGKTTLVCKLVEALAGRDYEVGTVKHDAHRFEIDHEGKDTWRHREAGASRVAISSENQGQTCYIEQRYTPLPGILERMADLDYVVVEGFKSEGYPKLVIIRKPEHLELLGRLTPILAIATWLPEEEIKASPGYGGQPVIGINDVESMLKLVLTL